MKKTLSIKALFIFVFLFVLPCSAYGEEDIDAWIKAEGTIFADPFRKKLRDDWAWLKEVPKDWRITDEALEIKMEPLPGDGARNILYRKVPKVADGPFVVTVEVKAVQPYTNQYQQTGLFWMQDDKHKLKLVMERIDGQLYVFPGKKPLETEHVVLRLRVDGTQIIAEYQPKATGEFLKAFEEKLSDRNDETDRIAIQCWHGPADTESWSQFKKFSITTNGRQLPKEPMIERSLGDKELGDKFRIHQLDDDGIEFEMTLAATIRKKDESAFDKEFAERKLRIRAAIIEALRASTLEELRSATNQELRAKIKRRVNEVLDKPYIVDVLVIDIRLW